MPQDPAAHDTASGPEAPWTEYVEAVLRSWRMVVYACLVLWAAILLAALLVPRDHLATAAISLPDLKVPETDPLRVREEREERPTPLQLYERLQAAEPGKRTGVPIAFYKEMERTLTDEAVLNAALKDQLSPRKIARILRNPGEHFKVLTTNPRNELERIQPTDGITGVVVLYETHPAERARRVIEIMAGLVRDAFVTNLARHEIQQQMFEASRTADQARQDRLNLLHANESLDQETADLSRLLRDAPTERGPQAQVMVNTRDRGYLFVSPAAQLVGVRAAIAENSHLIRTFEREAGVNELKMALLRQVDTRLRQLEAGGSPMHPEVASLLRQETDAFLKGKSGHDADFVRAQMEGLSETLVSAMAAVRPVQTPTLQRERRGLLVGLGMAAAVLLVLAATVVHESWRRWHLRAAVPVPTAG
jgi:hypothetical protein